MICISGGGGANHDIPNRLLRTVIPRDMIIVVECAMGFQDFLSTDDSKGLSELKALLKQV